MALNISPLGEYKCLKVWPGHLCLSRDHCDYSPSHLRAAPSLASGRRLYRCPGRCLPCGHDFTPKECPPRAGPVLHRGLVLLPGELCEASTIITPTVRMRRHAAAKGAASYPHLPAAKSRAGLELRPRPFQGARPTRPLSIPPRRQRPAQGTLRHLIWGCHGYSEVKSDTLQEACSPQNCAPPDCTESQRAGPSPLPPLPSSLLEGPPPCPHPHPLLP